MTPPLSGKPALVTGGTRGIGRAIAERLRADGAAVTVTGTRSDGTPPEGCTYRPVDFADDAATAAFADWAGDQGFDIVVNNAGINVVSPFAEIDPDDFARIQQVNVTAPFRVIRAAIPGMKARGGGRIVTVSSIWSKIAKEGRGSYAASKFAVDGLTAALAAEVAEFGILANCVSPGFIETDMSRSTLGAAGMKELAARVPMRRLGQPEEIANVVAFLVGPGNTYISGQNIVADGGFTRV